MWNFGILHIEIFEMLFKLVYGSLGVAISLWVGKVPGSNPALILFSPWMAQSGIIVEIFHYCKFPTQNEKVLTFAF